MQLLERAQVTLAWTRHYSLPQSNVASSHVKLTSCDVCHGVTRQYIYQTGT